MKLISIHSPNIQEIQLKSIFNWTTHFYSYYSVFDISNNISYIIRYLPKHQLCETMQIINLLLALIQKKPKRRKSLRFFLYGSCIVSMPFIVAEAERRDL